MAAPATICSACCAARLVRAKASKFGGNAGNHAKRNRGSDIGCGQFVHRYYVQSNRFPLPARRLPSQLNLFIELLPTGLDFILV
jgi:hypothetical protein